MAKINQNLSKMEIPNNNNNNNNKVILRTAILRNSQSKMSYSCFKCANRSVLIELFKLYSEEIRITNVFSNTSWF